jgi:hypothetical protein
MGSDSALPILIMRMAMGGKERGEPILIFSLNYKKILDKPSLTYYIWCLVETQSQ